MTISQGLPLDSPQEPGSKLLTHQEISLLLLSLFSLSFYPPTAPSSALQSLSLQHVLLVGLWVFFTHSLHGAHPVHQPISTRASHLSPLGLSFPVYKMMGAAGGVQ